MLKPGHGVMCRSYGILDTVFHNIADTHVCHHLFSLMPHYHAKEATKYIKEVSPAHDRQQLDIMHLRAFTDWLCGWPMYG